MFGAPVSSGLTLGKVISGLSKTLSLANQVIPLYKQAKPMISNAKTILSVLKEYNATPKNKTTNIKENNPTKSSVKKDTTLDKPLNNGPKFFL